MKKRGKFIVIEGTDGSGKGEQFKLLTQALTKKKIKFVTVDFPQYGKPSAYFVERYLNGDYGAWQGSQAKLSSIFYALDRFDVGFQIREQLEKGLHVLANRYVASNMGHQGAKFSNIRERKAFIKWVYDLEYNFFGVPKPDLNMFLSVPPKIAYDLVAKKSERAYLKGKKRDIHEASLQHLTRAALSYGDTIKLFPKEFKVIECAPRGVLRTIPEIQQDVLKLFTDYVRS